MDTLLQQGDHAADVRGHPIVIEGVDELMQRALIRLGVRRGSWFADPALGSRLYTLPAADTDSTRRLALGYVREALLPLSGLRVLSVDCRRPQADTLTVAVELEQQSKTYLLEVNV